MVEPAPVTAFKVPQLAPCVAAIDDGSPVFLDADLIWEDRSGRRTTGVLKLETSVAADSSPRCRAEFRPTYDIGSACTPTSPSGASRRITTDQFRVKVICRCRYLLCADNGSAVSVEAIPSERCCQIWRGAVANQERPAIEIRSPVCTRRLGGLALVNGMINVLAATRRPGWRSLL
jgi:hypothetical protein